MRIISGNVTAAKGFQASGVYCGIRKNKTKLDLALIYSKTPCAVGAVFTQNLVKGAPILVTKEHLKKTGGYTNAIVCNSGNANTCNADGLQKAAETCACVAKELGLSEENISVSSTGVIGQPLPVDKITQAVPSLVSSLSEDGGDNAAEAILTTDLAPKELAVSFEIGGKLCHVAAIAKGSGMIHPNMATMLVFVTTDCAVSPELLQKTIKFVADKTYNRISVDGDSSTNDTLMVLANGEAGNQPITTENDEGYTELLDALLYVCTTLSKKIAKDGEGATKLLECQVRGRETEQKAVVLAKSVITSSLFKAAMFGADANWGRILCALGYAGVPLDVNRIDVSFHSKNGGIKVCENGAGLDFDEDLAKQILLCDEIFIEVDLKEGQEFASAWGCDLTYDYVKINGDYRT